MGCEETEWSSQPRMSEGKSRRGSRWAEEAGTGSRVGRLPGERRRRRAGVDTCRLPVSAEVREQGDASPRSDTCGAKREERELQPCLAGGSELRTGFRSR